MNKVLEYKLLVQLDPTDGQRSGEDASLHAEDDDAIQFADLVLTLLDDSGLHDRIWSLGGATAEEQRNWKYEASKLLTLHDLAFSDSRDPVAFSDIGVYPTAGP